MNRKKRSKAERINEQIRLELLKLDPSKKEPPPADTDKVRYRKGVKHILFHRLLQKDDQIVIKKLDI